MPRARHISYFEAGMTLSIPGVPTGYLRPPALDPLKQAELFLCSLFHPTMYIELRAKAPGGGMVQSWHPCPLAAAKDALAIGHLTDVYVGVLPRSRRNGGADAVVSSRVVWVECDTPHSVDRVLSHEHPPSMVVCSSPGRAHAYWQLTRPLEPVHVARGNRRLAHALSGDLNATDSARILRVPGTFNHKHSPPSRVFMSIFAASPAIEPAVLWKHLPDPPATAPTTSRPARPRVSDPTTDRLRALSSREYATALASRDLTGHMMQCPFHKGGQERSPSFHIGGPDPAMWFCHGCSEGGDIFRFAARLWGLDEQREFPAIVKRLGEALR
jgi:hypothetical protein